MRGGDFINTNGPLKLLSSTPHEIKTIITRAGDDNKIVLTGDSFQIDNPYVDSADRFKGESISAHVTYFKGERSKLASNLL